MLLRGGVDVLQSTHELRSIVARARIQSNGGDILLAEFQWRINDNKDRVSNQEVDGGFRRKPANIDQNRRRAVWKSGVSCYNCLLSIDHQRDLQSIDLNITQCSGIDALVSVGALFQEKSQCLSIQFCN